MKQPTLREHGSTARISHQSSSHLVSGPKVAAEPGPWRTPGHLFCPGQFFGSEEGGDVLRMLEDCVLMFVPRHRLREALREGRHEVARELEAFLRRSLPGGAGLERRVLDTFAAACQEEKFSRGRVLCAAGVQATPEDHHKVYIIRSGSCRLLLPGFGHTTASPRRRALPRGVVSTRSLADTTSPTAATSPTPSALPSPTKTSTSPSPAKGVDKSPRPGSQRPLVAASKSTPTLNSEKKPAALQKPPARATPVGLLGEGAVVGFASALFGVPEPFTVVPDEPVEVMSVSLADRPVALWPREVIKALHEQMKAQADWHRQRTQSIASATAASLEKFAETGEGPPAWSVCDSPFLRHKELSSWQAGTMKDRFEAEGWQWKLPATSSPTVAGGSAAVLQGDSRSSSCPVLPALAGPKSPQAEGGRKAGLATPWGEWSPSGQLPPPRPK
ncbi:unnamed protein product, partial [Prorocentrum cordatum]